MKSFIDFFPKHLREFLEKAFEMQMLPEEIRMRIGQPMEIVTSCNVWYWNTEWHQLSRESREGYRVSEKDIKEVIAYMSNYSLYAFEEELKAGFFTILGGHRVGVAGKVICEQDGIKNMQHICFLNIRVAREYIGCSKNVIPYLRTEASIYNTLIVSPPGAGKTTLLRDCIRELSYGDEKNQGLKIGVIDERSEIAACYLGVPQNDVGFRTDVLDCCPKTEGMYMMLRSMSPEILAVDELGGMQDYQAVERVFFCGCKILASIHAEKLEDLQHKVCFSKWLEQGIFQRFIFLRKDAKGRRTWTIYNERLEEICKKSWE